MFGVGDEVRVFFNEDMLPCAAGEASYATRATVALSSSDGFVDIVLASTSETKDIDNVSIAFIQRLEPFENENISKFSPVDLKEQGNLLFGLKDFDEASRRYKRALDYLLTDDGSLSPGREVIYPSKDNPLIFLVAMVVSVDVDEVELDDAEGEEVHLPRSSLIPLASPSNRILQRSLYINLARCSLKLHRPGWAVRWSSLAMATTSTLSRDDPIIQKYKTDELFIRIKALLAAGRPQLAERDAQALIGLDDKKAQSLLVEIRNFREVRKHSNRRLVKQVMRWVDESMASSSLLDLPIHADEGI